MNPCIRAYRSYSQLTKRQLRDRADDARAAPNGRGQIGRYQLGPLLGVGGMAEVFKATDASVSGDRRTVVVKRILPTHSHDTEFVRLFMAEAKILSLCNHPNVVQAYDFGESEASPSSFWSTSTVLRCPAR